MSQSAILRSPIGIPLFWEKGAQPITTWEKWITTTKLAISAKENIQVEQLLRPRPTREELDYLQEPIYEPALPDETTAEKRQREQRNIKRNVDWKNSCQSVEDQNPMIDNFKWDEIDNKVKSLIYLSLGTEGTNICHQRKPHTELGKCTTDALVIQLQEIFKETRNETFDRFQFFRCTQNPVESLEQFHSRIKKKAELCNWEDLEDSLVKSIFIQRMANPQIQMDLLSEDRDLSETPNYAPTRKRGYENQQRFSSTHAQNPQESRLNLIQRTRQQTLIQHYYY